MNLHKVIQSLEIKLIAADNLNVGSWWNYKDVSSSFTRIFYIKSGSGTVVHSGREFQLRENSFFIIPAYTQASYYCEESIELYFAHVVCQMRGGINLFLSREYQYMLEAGDREVMMFARLIELNPLRKLTSTNPEQKDYSDFHRDCTYPYPDTPLEDIVETQGLLRLLITPFIRASEPQQSGNDQILDKLLEVMEFINTNLSKPIGLDDMAQVAHLHPTYLSDLFKKELDIRPVKYLCRKRVEHAQLLLTTTSKPIKRIAAECGYKDSDYFFRVFKKATGVTPKCYRGTHL